MKIEVWQSGPENWHAHVIGGSDITFSAGGYNTWFNAGRAVQQHFIAVDAFNNGVKVRDMPPGRKAEIRAHVKGAVKLRGA